MAITVRVRLFALQRELAGAREVALELPEGADVEAAWSALVDAPSRSSRPAAPSLRFARNGDYADPTTVLADGDEVAMIPPVSGGGGDDTATAPSRAASWSSATQPSRVAILAELADALATPEDGAAVGFLGRTRSTPGTPAPGQEAEAARHAGRRVESLEYEAHEPMALTTLTTIADEIARALRGRAPGDRPPDRRRPARRAIDRRRGGRAASRRRVRCGTLRDRRDEGAGTDLEGRAIRRRPRLDRPPRPGPDRRRVREGLRERRHGGDRRGQSSRIRRSPTTRAIRSPST